MPRLQVRDARGNLDRRRDLTDRACDHSEVLGAPPLTEPDRAQAVAFGRLRLADDDARVGDAAGKHIGTERDTAGPDVIHDRYSDSSVQYCGKGLLMAYTSARGDLGDRVGEVLHAWLPPRLAPGGARAFDISEFGAPPAGYSGKTVFFTANWTDAAGRQHADDLVLRAQADDHQLFTAPDAPRQAEVMQRLGAHGIPVPDIVGIEYDATMLGSPFYLMRKVRGRTPSDVPSWHKRGWTVDLSAAERSLLCDNGLRALVDRAPRHRRRRPRASCAAREIRTARRCSVISTNSAVGTTGAALTCWSARTCSRKRCK